MKLKERFKGSLIGINILDLDCIGLEEVKKYCFTDDFDKILEHGIFFLQINDFRFDMGEFASINSKAKTEMLKKNRLDILAYQYPPNIDSSRIGIQNGIKIMAIIKYGNKELSIKVHQTQTPKEILGY